MFTENQLYFLPLFNRPYDDSNYRSIESRVIHGLQYNIFRPNHGICHSLRQGFLARDIVRVLSYRQDDNKLSQWVVEQIKNDSNFENKVFVLAAFQRSGRESEASSEKEPELHESYEMKDKSNFVEFTSTYVDISPFDASDNLTRWSRAIWNDRNDSFDEFVRNLNHIIKAAHHLDLRRIKSFDKKRILNNVSRHLRYHPEWEIIKYLWVRSGLYLSACGDTDMEYQNIPWEDKFFILQQTPFKLYTVLSRV